MKSKRRMTIEEVNEFNPSYLNPMKLVSDKRDKDSRFYCITVPSKCNGHNFFASNSSGRVEILAENILEDFPSLKPEEPKLKEVVMYQTLFKYKDGVVAGDDFYENISEAMEARLPSLETVGYKPVTVYLREGEE